MVLMDGWNLPVVPMAAFSSPKGILCLFPWQWIYKPSGSIRPEGLYIHCHGKRHKIPFIEEKAAIGMTGTFQPSIKAIEMELNDNCL